jgi:glycosyltransferase involved in cell wall biosynthesis
LRTELVERGYRQVRRFSWERCARETLAVLEESSQNPTAN